MAAAPRLAAAQQVDLVLNMSDAPDPVPATGIVTYSMTVTNDAATLATGVTFTMTMPANATYNGFTGTGVTCTGVALNASGGTLTCTLPNLAFSQSVAFTIRVKSTTAGLLTATGTVSSGQVDSQLLNNSSTETTTVVAGADVAMLVTAPGSANAGSTISYGFSVSNAGPDAATSLQVQFPLPTGFTQTGSLPSGCTLSGSTITCIISGSIANGATKVIGNISGQISAGGGSTVTGSASVSLVAGAPLGTAQDPSSANNTAVFNTSVTGGSDVAIAMTRSTGGPSYLVGATFSFQLATSFTGDTPTGLQVVDVIPANYTINAGSITSPGWTCSVATQTVTCTRATGGAPGLNVSLGTITIPVTVASAGSGIVNTATISSAAPTDPTLANNTANDGGATLLAPGADLEILKSGPNPLLGVVNVPFDWTLSARNNGPASFFGTLQIVDNIPANMVVNSYTLNGWSCLPAAAGQTGPIAITCTRVVTSGSPLAAGATTPSFVINTTPTTTGNLSNSATLSSPNPNIADPNLGNNTITVAVNTGTPAAAADVRIFKSVDLANAPSGDVLTFTLEVQNAGPVAAANVVITDDFTGLLNGNVGATAGYGSESFTTGLVLPADMSCSNSALTGTSRRLTCNIVNLPVCVVSVNCPKITVFVRPGGEAGSRTNTATAFSSSTADNSTANNTGSVTYNVLARADMRVTKTGTPNPVQSGTEVTYVIAAINFGPSTAAGVSVSDVLPADMKFVSVVASNSGVCTAPTVGSLTGAGNQTVTCTYSTVPGGQTQRTITIKAIPTNVLRNTTIVNTATVSATTTEPASAPAANNTATASVLVSNPSTDLLINNTDTVDPLTVGLTTTYNVTVSNAGPSDAENVVITDTLPSAGLSFQSFTISSGTCGAAPLVGSFGGIFTCTVPLLAAGANVTLALNMKAETKGVFTNRARVVSDETNLSFENPGNNAQSQNTTVRTSADMEVVSKTSSSATLGLRRPFTWTIRVRNNVGAGLAEADAVHVTDALPTGMELTGTPTIAIVTGTTSVATCTGTATQTSFDCDLGTVSIGGVIDVTVPVRFITQPAGVSTNTAIVTTTSLDPVPANNSNTGSVTIQSSTLAGTIFRDLNVNSVVDGTDTGISGVTVNLTGTAFDAASITASTTTLADGTFSFAGLPEGTYTVTRGAVSVPPLVAGNQVAGNRGGNASVVTIISGIALAQNDAGTGYLFPFVPPVRIGIAKRTTGATTNNGNGTFSTTFRLHVQNYGAEALTSVVVKDPLSGAAPSFGVVQASNTPSGDLLNGTFSVTTPAFVGACAGGSIGGAFNGFAGGTGINQTVATITSLAVGASCDVQFSVVFRPTAPPPAGGYSNQATAEGTGAVTSTFVTDQSQDGTDADPDTDDNPGNNNTPTPVAVTPTADVLSLVTFPASVAPGATVSGTILYKNNGPFAAAGVGFQLQLTTGLAGVTFGNLPPTTSASYNPATGVVTFVDISNALAVNQIASGNGTTGITLSYTQPVSGTSTVSSLITTTTNQGANLAADASTATITGAVIADVTTSLAFPPTVNAGSTVSGTVLYKNNGPSTGATMTYTLTLSTGLTGLTFGNLPAGAAATYTPGTGVVTLTGMPATLATGVIASLNGTTGITVSYTQHPSGTSTVASTIGTSTDQGANVAPDAANATINGVPVADVTTSLAFPAVVNAGSPVTGTILFQNNGPSTAVGVSYILTLTSGAAGVTLGNLPAGVTATFVPPAGVIVLTGMPTTLATGVIASGNGTTGITLTYTQPPTATSTISSNIGTTTDQGANVAPDAATTSPAGVPIADVRTVVVFPANANAGVPVNGTVTFDNTGPSTAAGVTYSITLNPNLAGLTFGNLPAGAAANYAAGTGVVTFTGMPTTLATGVIASLNGTSGITVQYTQPGSATSEVTALITTTTNQGANVAPDAGGALITGGALADVTTSLAFPVSANAGVAVTGTALFQNNGPSTAATTTFSLTLSTGLTGVSFSNLPAGAAAVYTTATGVVTLTGMPTSLASGAIASLNGTTGIVVNYTQPGTATSTISSTIGTSTDQGANVAPDAATTTLAGVPVADVTTSLAFPAIVNAGNAVTGTILFQNNGPSTAAGVTYTLTLTPNLTGVTFGNVPGGATATYTPASGVVAFTGMPTSLPTGTIASGNGTTGITLSYTQPPTATSTISSTIATTTDQGANLAPDAATTSPTGVPIADVRAAVSFPATVNAGLPVNGTVTFSNTGPSTAAAVTYRIQLDTGITNITIGNLPAGAAFSYASLTGLITFTGMPATLTTGQIASLNGTSGLTLGYTQPGPATSTVTGIITTTTDQGANVNPDNASATINGLPIVDVTTALVFPPLVNSGSTVNGTLLYRNAGPSTAANVTYSLTLSPGLTGVTLGNLPVDATFSYASGTGVVTLSFMPTSLGASKIASGNGTTPITVSYTQPPVGASTVASVIGTTTSQGANVLPDAANATILGEADVTTSLAFIATANADDPVSGRVVFRNNGPSTAASVTYTLTLAQSLTGVSFSNLPAGAAATYNASTGVVTLTGMPTSLTVGQIASGDGTQGIVVRYDQHALGTSTITSTIGTSTSQGANVLPDAATTSVNGGLTADLAVTKIANVAQAQTGQTIAYTIRVENRGPSTVGGALLTDSPSGLELLSAVCSPASGNSCTSSPSALLGAGVVLPQLTTANFYEVLVSARVTATTGSVTNVATVATPPGVTDRFPFNNTATAGPIIVAGPNMAITKDANGLFAPGAAASYTIGVSNGGTGPTIGPVTVVDVLPAGVSYVSATGAGWSCSASGQTVTCVNASTFVPGGSGSIAVAVTVAATAQGTLTNTATVSTPGDLPGGPKSASVTTTLGAPPNVATTKSVNTDLIAIGNQLSYTITVRNTGGSPTTANIVMTDQLPTGIVPSAASGVDFNCSIAGQTVTCTRTTPLLAGASATITITAGVTSSLATGSSTNTACSVMTGDTNAADNCGSVTTPTNTGRPNIVLRKEASPDFIVGQPGYFKLWVKNTGNAPATGTFTLIDSLPKGLTFFGADGNGWSCSNSNGVVQCTSSQPIAAGDSTFARVVTTIGRNALGESVNCAVVAWSGVVGVIAQQYGCVTTHPRLDYRIILTLTTPQYEMELGDRPDFIVTVRNIGNSPLPDVVVTNTLPRGFTYIAHTSRRGGSPARGASSPSIGSASGGAPLATAGPTYSIPDPSIKATSPEVISWPVGEMLPGDTLIITYKALIRTGAAFNTDNITGSKAVAQEQLLNVQSNTATVPIKLKLGLFDDRGTVAGKVYMRCNCTAKDSMQTTGDVGIPGVRVMLEDGTGAITDEEGKYNFIAVRAGMHVVKVDRATLPNGAQLIELDNRNAGDPYSRFVDLKSGELFHADFAEGSRSEAVLNDVMARRGIGEIKVSGDSAHTPVATPAAQLGDTFVPITSNSSAAALNGYNSNLPMSSLPALNQPAGQSSARQGTIELRVPMTGIPADGRTITPVRVRILDVTGEPVKGSVALTLEASAGGWLVPNSNRTDLGTEVVVTNGEATFNLMSAREPVAAQIRASTSVASATSPVLFIPAERPLIATGMLQGRIDLKALSRGDISLNAADNAFEDPLQDLKVTGDSGKVSAAARGAVFMKGNVEGAGLVTLAFDSERDKVKGQFRDIQPDNYFPTYGDASLREFDAQTAERFYLRVDRGTSFLRYGDFTTPRLDDRRVLTAYNRSLTGLFEHYETKNALFNGFVSQNRSKQMTNEIPGRGLSGPYYVSNINAVTNSERVEIVTRDRNQPSIILKTQLLNRFEDYTFEAAEGRLLFKAPVPSLDENLNPVAIRVSYEQLQGGTRFLTYGGDGQVKIGSSLELGGFLARDENPLDKQTLAGGNITAKLAEGTFGIGEYAHADDSGLGKKGDAWRLELRHQSAKLDARIFGAQSDTGFANQSSTFLSGRHEYGARFSASLGGGRLIGEALRTESGFTSVFAPTGRRDGASLSFEQRITAGLTGEVGYRWADESKVAASTFTQGVTPFTTNSLRARVTSLLPGSTRSSLFGEYEQSIDDADARRFTAGAEYLLMDRARLYARHEWISSFAGEYALNDKQSQQNTVFGVDADVLRNGQVFSEYRLRDAMTGRDAEASIGLRNRFALAPGVLANASFERVSPLGVSTSTGQVLAVAGGLEFTQSQLWKGSTRLEWRTSSAGDNFLGTAGYMRKLTPDWTVLSRTLWEVLTTDQTRGRSQIGLAWRQTDVNGTNALFRLENRYDLTEIPGAFDTETNANIAALLFNTQPKQHLTLSGRYAAKITNERKDGETQRSTGQLLMGRSIYDFTPRVDGGLIGSIIGDGSFGQRRYGIGAELGVIVMRNLRLAGGYNLFGFTDKDFESLGYTQKGPYLEFGFKFDESLFSGSKAQVKP